MAFAEETRLRRIKVAVETAEGVELWLAEIPASLLRAGVVLELDEGSYEIVGFGSSGIVGAPTRVVCRPAPTEDGHAAAAA